MNEDKQQQAQQCINTLRTLSIDAVQQANSGHPGAPMALAPVVYCLWQELLRYDPAAPMWPNRDRFVLSNGHASMLLYSMLYLAGVGRNAQTDNSLYGPMKGKPVTLDDIKAFRQLGSCTAGHPEFGMACGVETTTGPLGQGLASSVGMAIAGCWQAATFNRPDCKLFDYHVYALCGDGCLMEGVSSEAASLAGHLQLGNLCWIYDSNSITIEGSTKLAFTEDIAARFRSAHWQVLRVADANNLPAIRDALQQCKQQPQPSLIIVNSHIGYGSPNRQDSAKAHGEPLGVQEVRLTKQAYGWPTDRPFYVPDGVQQHLADGLGQRGKQCHAQWQQDWARYQTDYPQLAQQLQCMFAGKLPDSWRDNLPTFDKAVATRSASGQTLNALASNIPWLVGGSADLAPSTKTWLRFDKAGLFAAAGELDQLQNSTAAYCGQNMHFGVREHAMAAAANGMALCGLRPFVGTFLVFSDYARPAIRLAALMRQPVVYVFTHDSIGLGEDGPTHQPIEHLASLRAMPNLMVMRPADAQETSLCWQAALQCGQPCALVLSRQNLPILDRTACSNPQEGVQQGGYVLYNSADKQPDVVLLASGSEVHVCITAAQQLAQQQIAARVVSMPCWELFAQQPQTYQESVLPSQVTARVAVEAASPFGWHAFVGQQGQVVGINRFGVSAPAADAYSHLGITVDAIVQAACAQLQQKQ
ncbi:MAG: transketolase [Myxococcota bacterium]